MTAEGENIEDIDKTEAEIRLEQINNAFRNDEGPGPDSDPGAGGSMPSEKRRKSTIRFADDEEDQVDIIGPTEEEIRAMIERRQERRRSSIYHGEGSILFAASKEQSRFQQSRLNSPMLQKIRQKSSANPYGKSPLSEQTSYGDDDVFSMPGDFLAKTDAPAAESVVRPPSENSSTASQGSALEKKFLKNYMRISYTHANKIDLTDITESDADDSSYGSQHSGEASNGSETNTPRAVAPLPAAIAEPPAAQAPPLLYAKNPRIQQLRSRSPYPSIDT